MSAINPVGSLRSGVRSFHVRVITDFASFLQLKNEWDDLVAASAVEHPFLTHDWVRLWLECFGRDRSLHIIVVREGAQIAAIAPMLIDGQRLFGFRMRTLALIWNAHVPRCDFIVREQQGEIYKAVWDHIAAERRHWDLLLLPQLPEDSMILREFNDAASASGFLVSTQESGALPFIPISGTWHSYIESLPPVLLASVRNSAERLARLGAVERESLRPGSGQLTANLEDAFRMENVGAPSTQSQWRSGERSRAFYAKLAAAPGIRDSVRLHYLRSRDKRIAFDLSLHFKNIVYLLKARCLPEYAEYSPLHILSSITLENCFREGIKRYDFVGIEEDWARQWRCSTLSHHWMFIYSNSPRTALFHTMKFNPGPAIEEWARLHDALNAGDSLGTI